MHRSDSSNLELFIYENHNYTNHFIGLIFYCFTLFIKRMMFVNCIEVRMMGLHWPQGATVKRRSTKSIITIRNVLKTFKIIRKNFMLIHLNRLIWNGHLCWWIVFVWYPVVILSNVFFLFFSSLHIYILLLLWI